MSTGKVLLEVVCSSPEDCVEAALGGADRIELCSAIELGGLTPSHGLVEEALDCRAVPIAVMVRPRTGGFLYTSGEFKAMVRDVRRFAELGVQGVVCGVLDGERRIDVSRMREVVDASGRAETVFHRAFDITPDPVEGLESLIELGITRVLTSGHCQTAMEGAANIARSIRAAHGAIQILPGGGLRRAHVREFVRATGANQVHLTAFELCEDRSMAGGAIEFNGGTTHESQYRRVSRTSVEQVAEELI